MKKTLLELAYEAAKDLYEVNVIDAVKMREYDSSCTPPAHDFNPKQIEPIDLHKSE